MNSTNTAVICPDPQNFTITVISVWNQPSEDPRKPRVVTWKGPLHVFQNACQEEKLTNISSDEIQVSLPATQLGEKQEIIFLRSTLSEVLKALR